MTRLELTGWQLTALSEVPEAARGPLPATVPGALLTAPVHTITPAAWAARGLAPTRRNWFTIGTFTQITATGYEPSTLRKAARWLISSSARATLSSAR